MPLTPDEFYARRDDVQLAVMFFLKSNDFAYSVDEIVFELGGFWAAFPGCKSADGTCSSGEG